MTENTQNQGRMPELEVRIYPQHKDGLLANATVSFDGCFAVKNIAIREGKNGPFIGMPSRKIGGKYEEQCYPVTKEFREKLHGAIFAAYDQKMAETQAQKGQKSDAPVQGAHAAPKQDMAMTMNM